jgi:hypothetical protein
VCFFLFIFAESKNQEPIQDPESIDSVDRTNANDLQALQNHNLLIALGGVARGAGGVNFPISVSKLIPNFLKELRDRI